MPTVTFLGPEFWRNSPDSGREFNRAVPQEKTQAWVGTVGRVYQTKTQLLGQVDTILNPPAPEPVVEEAVEEPVVEEVVEEVVADEATDTEIMEE